MKVGVLRMIPVATVFAATWQAADATAQSSGQGIALDSYRCEQFLADAEHPNDAEKLLRTTMIVSWAAGYAAAYESNGPRADMRALQLVSTALGNICQEKKSQVVIEAFTSQLKSTLEHPTTAGENSSASGPDPTTIIYRIYQHLDLPGNDLRSIRNATQDSCAAECASSSECKGYSYDKWNRLCILKRDLNLLILSAKSVTGVKRDVSEPSLSKMAIVLERYRGKAFRDTPSVAFSQPSIDACESACRDDESCISFTFLGNSGGECRLFSDTGEYFSDKRAVSGIKVQKP